MFDTLVNHLDTHELFPDLTSEEQQIASTHMINYLNFIWELAEGLPNAHTPAGISDSNFLLSKANIVGKEFVGEKLEFFPLSKTLK